MDRKQLWPGVEVCLGICPDDPGLDPQQARYMGGFILKEGTSVQSEGEVEVTTLPGGRWAVLTYVGLYEGLTQAWQDAYRNWLPTSGEELRDTPPYKVYLTDPNKTPPAEYVTEIYIAVK